MRWRRFIGPAAITVVIAVVAVLWWSQNHGGARRRHDRGTQALSASSSSTKVESTPAKKSQQPLLTGRIAKSEKEGFHFLSQPTPEAPDPVSTKPKDKFKYRLTNTPKPIGDLVHNEKAILLENAFFDTTASFDKLTIPPSLAADGDPGAY